MYDWDHNGRIDHHDHMMNYVAFNAATKGSGNGSGGNNANSGNEGCGTFFLFILIISIIISFL